MNISELKKQLNRVFDDNLHTRQWENLVDYSIIGLIVLSTLQIFLSTYDGIEERYGTVLRIIDYGTIAIFSVEVALRIWCADLLDDKYKGFWGRVRYCTTFYGLIDIVSTYSFYVALFLPIPYNILKVLRVARLLRLFRYMKAFSILNRAMSSKKSEMLVSLQFLAIVTLVLSFILFFVEHEAQPEVYDNGWTSVVWAFVQYIGDPGGFGDTPPITFTGRIIASIIGILGIAIFAVPAGLIASGFSEAMDDMQKEEAAIANGNKIRSTFYIHPRKLLMNFKFWPATFMEFNTLKSRFGLTEDEIFAAVNAADDLRVVPNNNDFAVELLHINTPYGFCSKEDSPNFPKSNSNVTIISHNGRIAHGITYCAYELARIGGFNLVANEMLSPNEDDQENRAVVLGWYPYQYSDAVSFPKLHKFVMDVKSFVKNEQSWAIVVSRNTDYQEPCVGIRVSVDEVGPDNTIEQCNTQDDPTRLRDFYDDLCEELKTKHNLDVFLNFKKNKQVCGTIRKWGTGANAIELQFSQGFIEQSEGDANSVAAFKTIGEVIHRHFETVNTEWNTENWGKPEAKKYAPNYEGKHVSTEDFAWVEILKILGPTATDSEGSQNRIDNSETESHHVAILGRLIRNEFREGEEVAILFDETEQRAHIQSITIRDDKKLVMSLDGNLHLHPGMYLTNNLCTRSKGK